MSCRPVSSSATHDTFNDNEANKKTTLKSRAAMFLSGKSLHTKWGRSSLLAALGPDWTIILNAVRTSVGVVFSKKEGTWVMNQILKMVGKVAFSGQCSFADLSTEKASESIRQFADVAFARLDPGSAPDPDDILIKALVRVFDTCTPLLEGKLSQEHLNSLKAIFETMSSKAYIGALMHDERLQLHRENMFKAMERLRQNADNFKGNEKVMCWVPTCRGKSLPACHGFDPVGLCANCHFQKFQVLIDSPSLEAFLNEARAHQALTNFLSDINQLNEIQFLQAVNDFKNRSLQNLRIRSYNLIAKKYLSDDNPLGFSAGILREFAILTTRVNIESEPHLYLPSTVFEELEVQTKATLQITFQEQFLGSSHMQRYRKMYALPEYLRPDLLPCHDDIHLTF